MSFTHALCHCLRHSLPPYRSTVTYVNVDSHSICPIMILCCLKTSFTVRSLYEFVESQLTTNLFTLRASEAAAQCIEIAAVCFCVFVCVCVFVGLLLR